MKKLKTLCAVIGATAMLSGATFAAEQKFNVPEYTTENVTKETNEEIIGEGLKIKLEFYAVDRNGDGEVDLIESQEYRIKDGKQIKGEKWLYVDDDFDGYTDRILRDFVKAKDILGSDGIYDAEIETRLNTELILRYMRYKPDDGLL